MIDTGVPRHIISACLLLREVALMLGEEPDERVMAILHRAGVELKPVKMRPFWKRWARAVKSVRLG